MPGKSKILQTKKKKKIKENLKVDYQVDNHQIDYKEQQKAVELDEKENINYISCEDIEDKWVVYPWDINN